MVDLYSDILLDHFRFPRNKGRLDHPTVSVEGVNPLCGDQLTFDLIFDGDILKEMSFDGKGCAISMASASMLSEILTGRNKVEIEEWIARFRDMIRIGKVENEEEMGDLLALRGISELPVRVKCATLPWTTIEEALHNHSKDDGTSHDHH